MSTELKEKLTNLLTVLEGWEEAYIKELTRRGNSFQEKIEKIKKLLSDQITTFDDLKTSELKEAKEVIKDYQEKILSFTDKIQTEKDGLKRSRDMLKKIYKIFDNE